MLFVGSSPVSEDLVRRLLADGLEVERCAPEHVTTVAQALAADAVVVDADAPGEPARHVIEQLARSRATAQLPIVVLSRAEADISPSGTHIGRISLADGVERCARYIHGVLKRVERGDHRPRSLQNLVNAAVESQRAPAAAAPPAKSTANTLLGTPPPPIGVPAPAAAGHRTASHSMTGLAAAASPPRARATLPPLPVQPAPQTTFEQAAAYRTEHSTFPPGPGAVAALDAIRNSLRPGLRSSLATASAGPSEAPIDVEVATAPSQGPRAAPPRRAPSRWQGTLEGPVAAIAARARAIAEQATTSANGTALSGNAGGALARRWSDLAAHKLFKAALGAAVVAGVAYAAVALPAKHPAAASKAGAPLRVGVVRASDRAAPAPEMAAAPSAAEPKAEPEPGNTPSAAEDRAEPAALADAAPATAAAPTESVRGLSRAARVSRANRRVTSGHALLRRGQLDAAEAAYLAALNFVPDEPRALAGMVRISLRRKQAAAAVQYAERLVAKRPKSGTYQGLLGDALALEGEWTKARAAWKRAAALGNRVARQRLKSTPEQLAVAPAL